MRIRLGAILVAGLFGACAPSSGENGSPAQSTSCASGDNSVLVADEHAVRCIDDQGKTAEVFRTAERRRFEMDPSGRAFGVYERDQFVVHDANGRQLGSIAAPFDARIKLAGEGTRVLVPMMEQTGAHDARLTGLELRTLDGRIVSRIDSPALRFSRPSAGHVTLAAATAVERYTLDGSLRWTYPLAAHELAVAAHADQVLAVDAQDTRRVYHLSGGQLAGRAEFRDPVWNLASAPSGQFSAVTTRTRLHLFEDGVLRGSVHLPIAYAVSLAVSDDGYVLVGGKDADHRGRVLLYTTRGVLLGERALDGDDDAFRPKVEFIGHGPQYVIVTRAGVERGTAPGVP